MGSGFIFTDILLQGINQAITWLARIVIALFILLTVMLLFYNVLPNDPLQGYIAEFSNTLQPYVALLNYFVPVPYCAFSFAFFIAFKYFIIPFKLMCENVFRLDMKLNGLDKYKL